MWYKIVVWLIQHSKTAMRYVIEMRNEVADQLLEQMERIEEEMQRRHKNEESDER